MPIPAPNTCVRNRTTTPPENSPLRAPAATGGAAPASPVPSVAGAASRSSGRAAVPATSVPAITSLRGAVATRGVHELEDPGRQPDARAPAVGGQARCGERRVDDVRRAALAVGAPKWATVRAFDLARQRRDRDALAGGNVPDAGRRLRPPEAPQGVDDVEDVDEVTRLAAVTVDDQRPGRDRLVHEGGDNGALQARTLPRTVDVGRPGDRTRRPGERHVAFSRELVDAVVRHRRDRGGFGRGTPGLAIHGAAGRHEDEAA